MDSTCWNILVIIKRMVPAKFAVYTNENLPERMGEKDERDLCRAFIHVSRETMSDWHYRGKSCPLGITELGPLW